MEYRQVKREAFCRGCDRKLQRDVDWVVHTYSIRNRGQNILICKNCVYDMVNLIREQDE